MASLQHVNIPGYSAMLFRRTFSELALPGSLMTRCHEWLYPFRKGNKKVHWSEQKKTYTFYPSGATITFGYLENRNDHYRYQSSEFQTICFDELTHFEMSDYTYLFSRLRRTKALEAAGVPLRMLSACVDEGEVLTEKGWIPIEKVCKGDNVFSVNNNGIMELKPVTNIYMYHINEDIVRIRKKTLYMSFTKNHRILRRKQSRPNKPRKYEIMQWDKFKHKCFEVVRFPTEYNNKGIKNNPLDLVNSIYLAFMGIYLSEGSYKSTVLKGNYNVMVTQCDKERQRVIKEEIMDKLDINYCICKNGDFCFANKKLWTYVSQFGKAHQKFIPRNILENGSAQQLNILLKWLVFGDGSIRNGVQISYTTVSKQLANDVSEIGIKLGYKVKITKKVLLNPNHRDRYDIYLTRQANTTKVDQDLNARNDIELENFKGNVYCIGVQDNETFVLRQKGTVWISGNSNPGGAGAGWVKQRFLTEGQKKGRIFIPATLNDNPYLDKESYIESLNELSPLERAQLLEGNWDVSAGGQIFKRDWFEILDTLPEVKKGYVPRVRYWDLAATDASEAKRYNYMPAFTVGLKMAKYKDINDEDLFVIEDIVRFQKTPDEVERRIVETAKKDGKAVDT